MPNKSIFSNSVTSSSSSKSLHKHSSAHSSGSAISLSTDTYKILENVANKYLKLLAKNDYGNLPKDIQEYLKLYYDLKNITIQNSNEQVVIDITLYALTGAFNVNALYKKSIEDSHTILHLNETINDILSQKNTRETIQTTQESRFTVTRSFKLALVFRYYIMIYGFPEYGVGFQPKKLNVLADILRKRGIDPFS